MGADIHGKWQKKDKTSNKWQDIDERFSLSDFSRNTRLFDCLVENGNFITEDIEKELITELSKDFENTSFLQKSIKDLNTEGYAFGGAGYLTLKELNGLIKTTKDEILKKSLQFFIEEITKHADSNKDDNAEYRVIFIFDY